MYFLYTIHSSRIPSPSFPFIMYVQLVHSIVIPVSRVNSRHTYLHPYHITAFALAIPSKAPPSNPAQRSIAYHNTNHLPLLSCSTLPSTQSYRLAVSPPHSPVSHLIYLYVFFLSISSTSFFDNSSSTSMFHATAGRRLCRPPHYLLARCPNVRWAFHLPQYSRLRHLHHETVVAAVRSYTVQPPAPRARFISPSSLFSHSVCAVLLRLASSTSQPTISGKIRPDLIVRTQLLLNVCCAGFRRPPCTLACGSRRLISLCGS